MTAVQLSLFDIVTPAEKERATKKCSHCGEKKALTEYYNNSAKADGLDHRCKTCARTYHHARYHGLERPKTKGPGHRQGQGKNNPDFWTNVIKGEGCWEWQGNRNSSGYGFFKRQLAHRLAWEQEFGPVPEGLLVCHHCDNPRCVRPSHLFVGTFSDNLIDAIRKGRHRPPPPSRYSVGGIGVVRPRNRPAEGSNTE